MGIQGLLPFLKKIHQPVNISKFSGCTVAIDAYCWLHKGAFSCAEKLALGEKTDQYVFYCLKYINTLLANNIKPVMVFDGCHLPSKQKVEKARREKRQLNRKKAAQFLREGKRAEARECLQRCIDVSPDMALDLMNACRDRGVDCIVAPYEADAQLAYLNKIGIAQIIITEDSDLLLFGCEKVIFKMDHAGNGILIEQKRLNEVTDIQLDRYTFEKFRYMCILSGCDYLASLNGIGLVKANKVFKIARQADVELLLKKLSTYLKTNIMVPQEYIDGFVAANNTFLYQLVFDPLQRKLVPLNAYSSDVDPENMTYAGSYMPEQKAHQIALGNINIYTGEKFANFVPETFVPKYAKKKAGDMLQMLSIWSKNYRVKPKVPLHERQLPDRPNLKDKEVSVKTTLRRKSPRKRMREDENIVDKKSSKELSDMYSEVIQEEKKVRTDDIDEDLRRFICANMNEPPVSVRENADGSDDEQKKKNPRLRSPKFFKSLSKAHPEKGVSSKDEEEEKENGAINDANPSKRNIFVQHSPERKPKFNLNAVKAEKVRSRFFSPSTSETSTSARQNLDGFKPVHSNTANTYSNGATEAKEDETAYTSSEAGSNVIKNEEASGLFNHGKQTSDVSPVSTSISKSFKFSRNKSTPVSTKSPSTSAFNWSKFKFNKQDSPQNASPVQNVSKTLKQPFKNVAPVMKMDSFLNSRHTPGACDIIDTENSAEDGNEKDDRVVLGEDATARKGGLTNNTDDVEPGCDKTIEDSEEWDESSTLQSESSIATLSASNSFPCSIDSMCLSQSDFISRRSSQPSLPALNSDICLTIEQDDGSKMNVQKVASVSSYFKAASQNSSQKSTSQNPVSSSQESCSEKTISSGSSMEGKGELCSTTVMLIDSDDEGSVTDTDRLSQLSHSQPSQPEQQRNGTLNKGKTKPGCRVSGLSRKSKKSSSTPIASSKSQPNLKDMFSKFAHNKCEKPRLSHTSIIDLDNEETDEAWTPSTNNAMAASNTNTTQRKLLT